MSFVARLRPELIRVAPPWRTFEETISGLVAVLAGERLLPAAAEGAAIQAVTAREAASSTALLDIHAGVPHARLPGIKQPVAALATSPHGLYEAVPTVPIQVVALVLSPPAATAQHLTILAASPPCSAPRSCVPGCSARATPTRRCASCAPIPARDFVSGRNRARRATRDPCLGSERNRACGAR